MYPMLGHNPAQNYQNHNHYLDDSYRSAAFYKWDKKAIRKYKYKNNYHKAL
jgi:hypothetical protein